MKNSLHSGMSFVDYAHVFIKFLVLNDNNISNIPKNQGKKLHNLYLDNSYHNSYHNLTIQIRWFRDTPKNINVCWCYATFLCKFPILIKSSWKVGSETLLFHHIRTLVKLLRRLLFWTENIIFVKWKSFYMTSRSFKKFTETMTKF